MRTSSLDLEEYVCLWFVSHCEDIAERVEEVPHEHNLCGLSIISQSSATVNATPSPELGSHSTWSWSSSVAIFCSLVVVGRQSINESVVDKDLIVNSGCLGGYCIFILESRRLIWELEGEWVLFTLLSWILLIICGGLDKERGHSLSRQCTPPPSLANNPTWSYVLHCFQFSRLFSK